MLIRKCSNNKNPDEVRRDFLYIEKGLQKNNFAWIIVGAIHESPLRFCGFVAWFHTP